MSNDPFATLDPSTLSTITGGADDGGAGPNRTEVSGNLKVQIPMGSAEGQGSYKSSRTDYGACLDAMRGQTPQMIREACGLPGGNK